jgi:hypothetical protein
MNFVSDTNGNIYVSKDDEYYLIGINKTDDIEFEKVINKINKINVEENKISEQKINKQNSLHIKSIENAIQELEENDDDEEKDKFNDIYDKYNSYIYNPEQRFYHDEQNNDEEYDEDYDYTSFNEIERSIKLYTSSKKISYVDFIFDIPLYEVLIIDGDIGSTNLVFRTEIQNDQALYRLTIYTKGIILLNIIGTKIVKFIINPNSLEIKKDFHQNIKK